MLVMMNENVNNKSDTKKHHIMKIVIADSVKGGCGKTTIALKNAIKAASETNDNKVCMIDFDLLGSSIETFLTGKITLSGMKSEKDYDEESSELHPNDDGRLVSLYPDGYSFHMDEIDAENEEEEKEETTTYYLNDYFKGKLGTADYRCYTRSVSVKNRGTDICSFDLMMSSPHQEDKNNFKAQSATQFIEQIDYGYFAKRLIQLLKMLYQESYTHVVFDMPPNSDSYTDILFDLVYRFETENDLKKNGIEFEVEMLLISSLDYAHFNANLEWLKTMSENCKWEDRFLYESEENKYTFKLVMNDLINYEEIQKNVDRDRSLKPQSLKALLARRLLIFNSTMRCHVNICKIFYYTYDRAVTLSATAGKGVTFHDIQIKELLWEVTR